MNPSCPGRIALAAALCIASTAAAAIGRKDVLECGLPDGGRFVLKSSYDYSLVPLPFGPNSRESDRRDWAGQYIDAAGRSSEVPASVMYRNTEATELAEVCAHFGQRDGTPLAPYSYLRPDGSWLPVAAFPWKQLHLDPSAKPGRSSDAQRAALAQAGIRRAAYLFGLIAPLDGRLVYEQPLHRADRGYPFAIPFDAVYQAFSDDGGKSWGEPRISSRSELFELGKPWLAQPFRARPISINGKRIAPADGQRRP